MTLPTRPGDKASTGVCSCEETIPGPGVWNRDLLRESWMLLNGNSAENRVLLLLELPCACAHIFAHKMALLIIAHSSGAFPSPGAEHPPRRNHTGRIPQELHPQPAHPLVHHSACSIPEPLRMRCTTLLCIYKHPDIQTCQSLFSNSY